MKLDPETERVRELAYKAGFDAGVKHQKEAAPPQKANELSKKLKVLARSCESAIVFMYAYAALYQHQNGLAALDATHKREIDAFRKAIDEALK